MTVQADTYLTKHLSATQPQKHSPMKYPWMAIILLGIVHLSLAWALDAAGWAEGLNLAAYAVVLGILIGTLLAYTQWPAWWIRMYALLTGMAVALYLVSTLGPTSTKHIYKAAQVVELLILWSQKVLRGEPTGDNVIFVLDIVFLLWWISVVTTVELIRYRRAWTATLPTGIILVINAYYAPKNLEGYLLLYVGAALLLLVVVHLDEQMTIWEYTHVRYPLDVTLDFLRNGVLFAVLIVALAWGAPSLARSERIQNWLTPIRQPWHRIQEKWGRAFSTLRYESQPVVPVFGYRFRFQGAPDLHDTPFFQIQAPKGFYWRAAVYDRYDGNGWTTTGIRPVSLTTQADPIIPPWPAGEWMTQTVTILAPGVISLIGAPTPIHFSIPVRAAVFGPAEAPGLEIHFAQAVKPLAVGEVYTVTSQVSFPDATALRAAGTNYPQWVREYFLQVPDTVPERVHQLADRLTAPFETPYDKALALERHLRSIPYSEDIPAPPPNKDAVDWFLFEERRGYCDYYASAMAIMARIVGIPARVASGYARGVYDEQTGTWVVRESDAHTWPELYFPRYGWVPFEPTAGEPPLIRPEREPFRLADEEQLQDLKELDRGLPKPERRTSARPGMSIRLKVARIWRWSRQHHLGIWVWLGILLAIGYKIGRRIERNWRQDARLIPWLYRVTLWWARRIGITIPPAYTPREVAYTFGQILPAHRHTLINISRAYQVYTYAPETERSRLKPWQDMLYTEWKHMLPALGWMWLRYRWRRFARKAPGRATSS